MRPTPGLAMLLALAATAASAADGTLDPGFGTAGIAWINADAAIARSIEPRAAIELPDGKLLFAGARDKVVPPAPWFEPEIRGMLVRLEADGTPDATFGNTGVAGLVELPDLVDGRRMQGIEGFARFGDGSLVAVGTGMVNGPFQGYVVKLTAEGAVDTGFGNDGTVLFPMYNFHAVRIDGAGRIVVIGEKFDSTHFAYVASALRLLPDGEPDTTFGTDGVFSIAGTDPAASGYFNDLATTPDDGLVIGGAFESDGAGFGVDFSLVKLDADGALDPAFAGDGWRVFDDGGIVAMIEQLARLPDGTIVFAGSHSSGENLTGPIIGRTNADGSTDTSFGEAATPGYLAPAALPASAESANATGLLVRADGRLVASFGYYTGSDREAFVAIRTTANGLLDSDFADAGVFRLDAASGGPYSEIDTLLLQSGERIVAAGRAQRTSETLIDFAAVRLLDAASDLIFADSFD